MSVINDVLLAVIEMAQTDNLYATIKVGAMPEENGISMYIGAGSPETTFMDKGMSYEIRVTCNGKHASAKAVSDALNDIHQRLTQRKDYPSTDTYQITDIYTNSTPSYIEVDNGNRQTLFGSVLGVRFHYKKGQEVNNNADNV